MPSKKIWLGKRSVLIVAVLLFAISFIFNKLYINRSAVAQEVKLAEKYILTHEKDFNLFLKDTGLIHRLLSDAESLHEFNTLASKKYGIYIYTVNEFGNIAQVFTAYEYKAGLTPPENKRGINSIELVKEKSRWYIMSISWDEERVGRTIPVAYIKP